MQWHTRHSIGTCEVSNVTGGQNLVKRSIIQEHASMP